MTIPAWPSTVNSRVLRDGGWKVGQLDNKALRSEMNSGAVRQRRKYTLVIEEQTVQFYLSAAEYAAFKTFHRDTLGSGAARFSMPVWGGSSYSTCNVTIKDGAVTIEPHGADGVKIQMQLLVERP